MRVITQRLVLIVSGALCCLLASCEETEFKKRTLGYKGEARANGFLAAQRYLEAQGYEVETKSGVGRLNDEVSTIFLPQSSLNTEGGGKRIMEWVAEGGHIVVMLENGNKRGNDFTPNNDLYSSDDEVGDATPGVEYVLNEIGALRVAWENDGVEEIDKDDWEELSEEERVLGNSSEYTFDFNDGEYVAHHWGNRAIEYDFGDGEDSFFFISDYYGEGVVTILSDANLLRNRYIGYADHVMFLEMLIDNGGYGRVVFSSGAGDNLFSLIWRYFKLAVIGLAVVIIFWLWKNLPKFGPEQDVPESQMREFSGQVRGIGRFLWKHKRDDTMLNALRTPINRKLSMDHQGNHEGIFAQLSERTSLPIESVIEAMTRNQIRDHSVMVRVVKNLQIILKKLN